MELLFSFIKNEKFKDVVDIIATLIMIAFNVFLVIKGSELVGQMIVRHNLSGAMRLPMYIVYLVLPLSAGILSLRLAGQLVSDMKDLFSGKGVEE